MLIRPNSKITNESLSSMKQVLNNNHLAILKGLLTETVSCRLRTIKN